MRLYYSSGNFLFLSRYVCWLSVAMRLLWRKLSGLLKGCFCPNGACSLVIRFWDWYSLALINWDVWSCCKWALLTNWVSFSMFFGEFLFEFYYVWHFWRCFLKILCLFTFLILWFDIAERGRDTLTYWAEVFEPKLQLSAAKGSIEAYVFWILVYDLWPLFEPLNELKIKGLARANAL